MTTNTPLERETLTLNAQGISPKKVWDNLETADLYEHAVRRAEGTLTDHGALVNGVAVAPDGKSFAVATAMTILIGRA